MLLLYKPWRNENQLAVNGSYKIAFENCKDTITPTIKLFEPYYDDVDDILENFEPEELHPEVWQQVAAQCEQDKDDDGNIQQDLNFSFINPDNLPTVADNSIQMNQRTFSLTTTIQMPDTDYYQVLRSLNIKQRLLLDYIFKWTTDMRLSPHQPDPFYIFLSGGGGVGKSHLMNAIYQAATRSLRVQGQHPDQPTVLLTASTGKAATNISGTTLHSVSLNIESLEQKNSTTSEPIITMLRS